MHAKSNSVLLLAYSYPPTNTSGAARPHRLATYLPEFGHSVQVITAGAPDLNSPYNVLRLPNELLFWEKLVRYFLLPGEDGLSWIGRVLDNAGPVLSAYGITDVISTAPPFTTHAAALLLKKRYGLRWIADFRDPLVGNPFASDRWITLKIHGAFESMVFRHADALVAVTDTVADEWKDRYPQFAHKVTVIWNGYDPQNMFRPGPPPAREGRVMAHVGSLYGGRQPSILLSAMDRLLSRGTLTPGSLCLRLIGLLSPEVIERDEPVWHRLKAVGMLDWSGDHLPQTEAQKELAEADCLLLLDVNAKRVGQTVPAKLFEYVLCGRPILAITEPGSPVERTLSNSGIPFVCIYTGDPETVTEEKLMRFLQIPPLQSLPSRWFLEQFDGRQQTAAMAALLTRTRDRQIRTTIAAFDQSGAKACS